MIDELWKGLDFFCSLLRRWWETRGCGKRVLLIWKVVEAQGDGF